MYHLPLCPAATLALMPLLHMHNPLTSLVSPVSIAAFSLSLHPGVCMHGDGGRAHA